MVAGDHLQNPALSVTERLCPLALGDVDHGADEFSKIAGGTEDGMAYCVDVSDLAAGMDDAVIELEPCLFSGCFCELCYGPGSIILVKPLKEYFDWWQTLVRVKTQDAVAFLGPVPKLSGSSCPTACVTEPLRFR